MGSIYTFLGGKQLAHFYKIEIIRDLAVDVWGHLVVSKLVVLHSTVHKRKQYLVPWSYADAEFTNMEILHDKKLSKHLTALYGLELFA